MNTIYLIRNKATGLYWRGAKVSYGKEDRTPWTEHPAKARHFWLQDHVKQVCFAPGVDYEVVPFTIVEVTADLPASSPESSV